MRILYTAQFAKDFLEEKHSQRSINDVFQADLADMQNLARYKDNFRYLLTCVCVFSKFAFAIPAKDKRGTSIADAFEKILVSGALISFKKIAALNF
jgi:hypothetical protein